MRRSLAWLVAVPLMLVGSQAAHVLAFRLVYPNAGVRLRELLQTGHSYESFLPLLLGLAASVTVVSLLVSTFDAAHGRPQRALPAWAFALLPLVGFTVQEHLERFLASGAVPWHEFAAPTFLPGLALELPFGLLAYLVARFLLRVAERAGRAFDVSLSPTRARLAQVAVAVPMHMTDPPRPAPISLGLAKRGPPLLLGV